MRLIPLLCLVMLASLPAFARPYVIAIAGGSASGKTTLSAMVVKAVNSPRLGLIAQDWYYRSQSQIDQMEINGDHPDALEFPLLIEALEKLREGQSVEFPQYDYVTDKRTGFVPGGPYDVIILEGIHAMDPRLKKFTDYSVFVSLEENLRLERRMARDTVERGKTIQDVLYEFFNFVKPMHDLYIEPQLANASIVVSGKNLEPAARRLVMEIRQHLEGKPPSSRGCDDLLSY